MEYALSKKFSSGIAVFLIKLRTRHERTCSCKVFHRGWPKIEAPKKSEGFFYDIANWNCSKHSDLGSLNGWNVEFFLWPSEFSTSESGLSNQILGEISLNFLCKYYRSSTLGFIMGSRNPPAIPPLPQGMLLWKKSLKLKFHRNGDSNIDVGKHGGCRPTILHIQLRLFPCALNNWEGVSDWFFGCYHWTDRQVDPNPNTCILASTYQYKASHWYIFGPLNLCPNIIQSYQYFSCFRQFSALISPCSYRQSVPTWPQSWAAVWQSILVKSCRAEER